MNGEQHVNGGGKYSGSDITEKAPVKDEKTFEISYDAVRESGNPPPMNIEKHVS